MIRHKLDPTLYQAHLADPRAFCPGAAVIERPVRPLLRNRWLVRYCDWLIACPGAAAGQRCSGTWATWRCAKEAGRPRILIPPEGVIEANALSD